MRNKLVDNVAITGHRHMFLIELVTFTYNTTFIFFLSDVFYVY